VSEAPLWSGLALVTALDAYVLGRPPAGAWGASIDSRTLEPGDLFFAIRGDNGDGHDWVRVAFEKGACAAVVEEGRVDALRGVGPLYVVDDTLAAMRALGAAARARTKARIIAVTGSVGKTSTKEALRLALSTQGSVHASQASYNNHWGVPLTLARMPSDARFGVFEIGMNHSGEIARLVKLVRPHVAIVTTIAPVHLENLGSLEAIAEAKAEVFQGLEPAGAAILPRDAPHYELLRERAEGHAASIFSFGEREDADARILEFTHHEERTQISAIVLGRVIRFSLAAPGRHFAVNALAVLLAARALEVDPEAAAAGLAAFAAPKGRGRRVKLASPTGSFTLIDESYNANPTSMRAAIEVLGQTRIPVLGSRIAVLGDMLELGPQAAGLHMALADELERNEINQVFAAGPLMKGLYDAIPLRMRGGWAPNAAQLLEPLSRAVASGDVVMIKGSNGSRMGPLAAALEERFSPAAPDSTS
jgi:UDP-N-acetylmuramoyl-tripeptide--D-alanyl-D-alanine ligase